MIEHERSYIFTHEGAHDFLESNGNYISDDSCKYIEDYYIDNGIRIRKFRAKSYEKYSYIFTHKTGDKSNGYRFEFEEYISEALANCLIDGASLSVKKTRMTLDVPQENSAYIVTMDFIDTPMKLAILEIEALSEVVFPIPVNITQTLFGVVLKECPLCSCQLFNRHIGIAGSPSSGKSETAKILSHILNTQYDANSFHVNEFATTFIQKYKRNPNFWEEFFIWHGQHERERSTDVANIVFSDCPTFLNYIYLLHLPKEKFSASTALVLAKMYKRVLFDIDWYSDLIFLEMKDYKENGIRYQSHKEALQIQGRIRGFLDDHCINYTTYDYTQKNKMIKDLFYINE